MGALPQTQLSAPWKYSRWNLTSDWTYLRVTKTVTVGSANTKSACKFSNRFNNLYIFWTTVHQVTLFVTFAQMTRANTQRQDRFHTNKNIPLIGNCSGNAIRFGFRSDGFASDLVSERKENVCWFETANATAPLRLQISNAGWCGEITHFVMQLTAQNPLMPLIYGGKKHYCITTCGLGQTANIIKLVNPNMVKIPACK